MKEYLPKHRQLRQDDCFKYRTKLDNEIFNKAVNAYVADEKKNLANLSKYAKEMGVYKKMMSVMEVLLNG